MPNKFRKAKRKKNAERKIALNLFHVRKTGMFPFARKMSFAPFTRPSLITISTEDLTLEQIDLLKGMVLKNLIPGIIWIESRPKGLDDKIKSALLRLHSDEAKKQGYNIAKGYDYAWIKTAIDCELMPERYNKYKFMSTPVFVKFIKSLGFTDIAGSKTINKALKHAQWLSEDHIITFSGIHINVAEYKRRNNIALKFLEIMNEI